MRFWTPTSRPLAGLLAACLALPSLPAGAQAAAPGDVADLVGARAAGAETELGSRGYIHHHAAKSDDASYVYWWHPSKKQCIRVRTEDGRYAQIAPVGNSDCNQPDAASGPSTGAKVAIGAAALLGVAALMHNSHHRKDRDYNERQTADFERGYRDGLYNHPYHNHDNRREYSDGFSAGLDERRDQSSYRRGSEYRGGYQPHAYYADLEDKDKDYAFMQLERRGFERAGDRRRDGDRVTVHFWNGSTRQCLNVGVRRDRVLSVRDGDRSDCR